MARQVRIEYPGAVYHVMARGDRREDIYFEESDRELFYEALKEGWKKFGYVVHGYVLMSNHYHLLMETPRGNLVEAMKWLQNTFTRRMNVKHRMWGHLFGGRYKAVVVDDEESDYLVRVLDYIHLNPARIRWQRGEEIWSNYPHSSLRWYVGGRRPEWLEVSRGFKWFSLEDNKTGRRKFLERLKERVAVEGMRKAGHGLPEEQSLQSTLSRGWQFGTDSFREKMLNLLDAPMQKAKAKVEDGYRGQQMEDYGEKRAKGLLEGVEQFFELDDGSWKKLAKGDWRKCLAAALVQEETGMKLDWLCEKLWMGDRSYACRGIARMRQELKESRKLQEIKRKIVISINND